MSRARDEGRGGDRRSGPSGRPERGRETPWRSLLFFPGTRPDRYEKALASGADLVCADLEDAVGPGDKAAARGHVMSLVGGAAWHPHRAAIRLNEAGSQQGGRDLDALIGQGKEAAVPLTLVLPKVSGADVVEEVGTRLADAGIEAEIVAMIETALGLERAPAIARASRVVALFLGAVDLAAELGCAVEWDALLYARSRVVHAAALGGVQSIDVPFLDVHDHAGLEDEARAVARLGFTAKAAIHPAQIEPIHRALAPSATEVQRARAILDAYERSEGGVSIADGRMVDRPVVEAARRTLARDRQVTDDE